MSVPEDRRYTEQHEWALVEEGKVRVGITDYAQEALGDVVFVDLPEAGLRVETGDKVAEVESTKSVAEVYAPIAGAVVEVNQNLRGRWDLVNRDPYGEGWFVLLDPDDLSALESLLDAAAYRALIA